MSKEKGVYGRATVRWNLQMNRRSLEANGKRHVCTENCRGKTQELGGDSWFGDTNSPGAAVCGINGGS